MGLLKCFMRMVWLCVCLVACKPAFSPRMSEHCVSKLDYCVQALALRCPEGWDTITTSAHAGNANGPDYSGMISDTFPGGYAIGGRRPWYALQPEVAGLMYYSATVECNTKRTAEIPPPESVFLPPPGDRETGNQPIVR